MLSYMYLFMMVLFFFLLAVNKQVRRGSTQEDDPFLQRFTVTAREIDDYLHDFSEIFTLA